MLFLHHTVGHHPVDSMCHSVLNEEMYASDGVPLRGLGIWPQRGRFDFYTPSLRWWVATVSSPLAQRLTDNRWNPYTRSTRAPQIIPEIPPDASVDLRFSSSVWLPAIRAALILRLKDYRVLLGVTFSNANIALLRNSHLALSPFRFRSRVSRKSKKVTSSCSFGCLVRVYLSCRVRQL